MERGPVRQQEGLVALAVVGLEVPAARFAVVDAQAALAFDGHGGQPLRIAFAERAGRAPVWPARAAASAREQTAPPRIHADQLGHRGERSAGRAIAAEPSLVVPPAGERLHHRGQIAAPARSIRGIAADPADAGAMDSSSPSSQPTMRRAGLSARRRSACRAETSAARRPSSGRAASLPTSATSISPRRLEIQGDVRALQERDSLAKIAGVVVPGWNGGHERLRCRPPCRPPPRRSRATGRRYACALNQRSGCHGAQCPSPRSDFARIGMSRAPRPNRKMVAAIRPIETPHSKIDGA